MPEHPDLALQSGIPMECGICSRVHISLPGAIGYVKPADYFQVPQHEVNERIRIDSDLCSIDDSTFLIRGVIEIPLLDGELEGRPTFEWGMWARISRESFDRYIELYDQDGSHEPAFDGFLSGEPPGYKGLMNHPVTIHLRSASARPLFYLKPSGHLLYKEQAQGITLKRVHDIFKQSQPHYFPKN